MNRSLPDEAGPLAGPILNSAASAQAESMAGGHLEDLPDVLDAPTVARFLGCSRGLVYELCRSNRLGSLYLGRRLVIPKRAVERLLHDASEGRQAG